MNTRTQTRNSKSGPMGRSFRCSRWSDPARPQPMRAPPSRGGRQSSGTGNAAWRTGRATREWKQACFNDGGLAFRDFEVVRWSLVVLCDGDKEGEEGVDDSFELIVVTHIRTVKRAGRALRVVPAAPVERCPPPNGVSPFCLLQKSFSPKRIPKLIMAPRSPPK